MYNILALLGLGLLAIILQYVFRSIQISRRARQLGCQPLPRRKAQLPFGIDFVQEMKQADRDNTLPSMFVKTHQKVGHNTWNQFLMVADNIVTCEPENIKAILATQFKDFDLGPLRKGCFSPMFANGIFSDDGARWEHSRALIRPQFVRDQITDIKSLETHVDHLMRVLSNNIDEKGWTGFHDFVPLFFRQTLDSSTEFLFGQSVNSQLSAFEEEQNLTPLNASSNGLAWNKFGPAFDTATLEIGRRFRMFKLYFLHDTKIMRDSCSEVHRFADHFVQRALEQTPNEKEHEKSNQDGTKPGYVFLDELAKATRDPLELRDQLLNVLLAGRDTTAGLLAWIIYQLARQPDVYARLRKAVVDDFGTYKQPRNMNFAGLKASSYLQAVLNEGLRLHPSVPFNSRRAVRDTTIPVGGGPDGKSPVFVPKGTEVNYSVQAMQRRKDLWGQDADQFRPERWQGRRPGWEFLPFNGGPRICLGQQFALTTAGYTIARICQRFDQITDLVPHDVDPENEKYFYSVTGAPIHVKVRLHEAAEE